MLIDSTNSANLPVGAVHVTLYNTDVYTENHSVIVRVGVRSGYTTIVVAR